MLTSSTLAESEEILQRLAQSEARVAECRAPPSGLRRRPTSTFLHQLQHNHDSQQGELHERPEKPHKRVQGGRRIRADKRTADADLLRALAEQYELDHQSAGVREAHELRMRRIQQRRLNLQDAKTKLEEKVSENVKFVQEQMNKQLKARARYSEEHDAIQRLDEHLTALNDTVELLTDKCDLAAVEIEILEKPRELLLKLAAQMELLNTSGAPDIGLLIQKYNTLHQANVALKENLASLTDELEELQRTSEERLTNQETARLEVMMSVDRKQARHEALVNANRSTEQALFFSTNKHRQEIVDSGRIIQSLMNMVSACKRTNEKTTNPTASSTANGMSHPGYHEMLDIIQEFMLNQCDIVSRVRDGKPATFSSTTAFKSHSSDR